MSAHAEMSPSGWDRWSNCPGSVPFTRGMPDKGSDHADEGTAAHFLAAHCLSTGLPPADFYSRGIVQWSHPESGSTGVCFAKGDDNEPDTEVDVLSHILVDDEMVEAVESWVALVRGLAGDGEILVEQRVPIDHLTEEPGAGGTADAIVLRGDEIIVCDFKYGRGVRVNAIKNGQLRMYASGAAKAFDFAGPFRRVRTVIHQPRLGPPTEEVLDFDELEAWEDVARAHASLVRHAEKSPENTRASLFPTEEGCKFCVGKATCPALAKHVEETVGAAFEVLAEAPAGALEGMGEELQDDLAAKMKACDLIEQWIRAVRAEVERRLIAGVPVPGFKLVEGRLGPRKWADPAEAEAMLKKFRLKVEEMYSLDLISPTAAEKLVKAKAIGPRQWKQIETLITRNPGKPSVAPDSDARPSMPSTADAFDFV